MSTQVAPVITKSISLPGTPSLQSQYSVVGATWAVVEEDVAASATDTMSGISFAKAKCAIIYLLCDLSDCVVTFTNASGATTVNLTAGTAYEWDSGSDATNPLAHDVTAMTVQNNGAQDVSTPFHARFLLTA